MAKIKLKMLRNLHEQQKQIWADYDASCAAEKVAAGEAGEDNSLGEGPESSVKGAQDSRVQARVNVVVDKSMAEAFPHFNRVKERM